MNRYVFITLQASNLEILYAGFRRNDRGYVCLPFPWEKKVKEEVNKKEYYKEFIHNKLPFHERGIHFIIYGRVFEWWSVSIPEILRELYDGCVIIAYFGDLIETHSMDFGKVREECDYILTYDIEEANKYEVNFCQEPYSGYIEGEYKQEYDVCFVGRSKGRLKKLIEVYEYLISYDLKCEFYIFEAENEYKKYTDKIHYENFLDYKDVIALIKKSKCILEVKQKGSVTPSTRLAEALVYNRLLLTDCDIEDVFLVPSIICFDNPSTIDINELKKDTSFNNKRWIQYFSIESMIESISQIERGKP